MPTPTYRFLQIAFILVLFCILTFPSTSGKETKSEASSPLIGQDGCSAFTSKDECCGNATLNCTYCTPDSSSSSGVCLSTCNDTDTDLCSGPTPEPVIETCANYTLQDDCCKSNCSFCFGDDGKGVCTSQGKCAAKTKDNCTEVIPTTTAAPNTTTTSGNNTTTPEPATNTTTPEPATNTTTSADTTTGKSTDDGSSGQHFDSASFIGGIILCGGLVALAFFGLKFYKSRKEQNYHTL